MAQPVDETQALFKELKDGIDEGDFDSVVSTCNKILARDQNDIDALRSKLVAFLNLSKFTEALDLLSKKADAFAQAGMDVALERCYALYRLQRLTEAAGELEGALKKDPNSLPVLLLLAQVVYRQGDYERCASLYEEVLANHQDKVDPTELRVNLVAAYAAMGRHPDSYSSVTTSKQGRQALRSSYEFHFNLACSLLLSGEGQASEADLSTALSHLDSAKDIVFSQFEEESEASEESAAIEVQRAVVLAAMGDRETAEEALSALIKHKPSDEVVSLCAHWSLAALRSASSPTAIPSQEVARLIKGPPPAVEGKLTGPQKLQVAYDRAALALHSAKLDEARAAVSAFTSAYPGTLKATLLQAGLLVKEKKVKDCTSFLQGALKNSSSDQLLLCLAQVQVLTNDLKGACSSLGSLSAALREAPAVIATMVALCVRSGTLDCAYDVLQMALDKALQSDSPTLPALLRGAAELRVAHKSYREAAQLYQQILDKVDPSDRSALIGALTCASHFDPSLAESLEAKLPPMDLALETDLDVEQLENSLLPKRKDQDKGEAAAAAAASAAPAPVSGSAVGVEFAVSTGKKDKNRQKTEAQIQRLKEKRRLKRKKNIKYPKGYDPANPSACPAPDPERWVPKYLRASNKKKGGKKNIGKGPQGFVPTAEMEKEMNERKKTSTAQTSVASSASTAPKGSRRRR